VCVCVCVCVGVCGWVGVCVCTGRMEARGAEAYKGLLKVRRRVQNKRFVRTEGQGSFTVRLFEICVWDASQRERECVCAHRMHNDVHV